ncbi:hypothetical protein KSP39_PZI010643 [Platanthera zijinensis]|uniref:Uncharacterized protein n=1 Tax=Platanthera zijinensis TaxID=2320716 RepID=A0AAP0BKQ8_9ASPA
MPLYSHRSFSKIPYFFHHRISHRCSLRFSPTTPSSLLAQLGFLLFSSGSRPGFDDANRSSFPGFPCEFVSSRRSSRSRVLCFLPIQFASLIRTGNQSPPTTPDPDLFSSLSCSRFLSSPDRLQIRRAYELRVTRNRRATNANPNIDPVTIEGSGANEMSALRDFIADQLQHDHSAEASGSNEATTKYAEVCFYDA